MSDLQKTFSIIKPDAVATGKAGKILSLLEGNGFRVAALRMVKLSQAQAEGLLVRFTGSGRSLEAW